jgi:hypothetical protein
MWDCHWSNASLTVEGQRLCELAALFAIEHDNEQRSDRAQDQRDHKPKQAAAILGLRQPCIYQRQCSPADVIARIALPDALKNSSRFRRSVLLG